MVERGMIHGRFQPFHNGHLAYLAAAARRCRTLFVGVTNPDRLRTRPEADDPARHLPASNPFTYTERALMVGAAAEEAAARVVVIPFPVTEPELWDDYLPADAVQYVRLFSPWGEAKLERFRARGHRVEVLPAPGGKEVSGAQVRAAMAAGDDWRALVPPGVARVIDAIPVRGAPDPRRPA